MYDHTIAALPAQHPRFHWQRTGIAWRHFEGRPLATLSAMLHDNGHEDRRDLILKMDVEGAEWEVLANSTS